MKDVRVRFAPSPTGPLHIGGVRTALFNYLFAKKHKGTFVLRIEDTDQKRFVEGAEQYIIDALNWCEIPFDEGPGKEGSLGPYRQSERKNIYKTYAKKLIDSGHAYYAFDSTETLDQLRKEAETNKDTFVYNWSCRTSSNMINSLTLDQNEVDKRIQRGDDYVIRFKTPKNEILHLTDMIRGNIKIDTNILDDKVLFKSDGMPTYHLANIVDDYLMKITHVIRGEEWLPSLALHKQLYDALGWESPEFAHLPLILKPTGKGKLSKRDGDKLGFPVFPLEWIDPKTNEISRGYKEDGYFKEAVVNFLALLGWNPGTEKEHFTLEELINEFSIEKVNKAGARFDPDKIKWFNHFYMQKQSCLTLAQNYKKSKLELKSIDVNYLELVINKVKERANFISDFDNLTDYFFNTPEKYDEKAFKKAIKPDTEGILKHITAIIKDIDDEKFEANYIQSRIKNWITNEGLGFGKVMMPLRLALVGSLQGPDVFEIAYLIGKNETIKRIKNLLLNI